MLLTLSFLEQIATEIVQEIAYKLADLTCLKESVQDELPKLIDKDTIKNWQLERGMNCALCGPIVPLYDSLNESAPGFSESYKYANWGNSLSKTEHLNQSLLKRKRLRSYEEFLETRTTDEIHLKRELSCIICLELIDEPVFMYCGHHFHGNCIQLWLKEKNVCPVCAQDMECYRRNVAKVGLDELDFIEKHKEIYTLNAWMMQTLGHFLYLILILMIIKV